MHHFLTLSLVLATTACSRESLYDDGSFTQNVAQAFADCNEAEIKRLSMTHNIQTAFGRCGSNRFSHYTWSPDGVHLYFQLTHGSHVLNGQDKTITVVPTEGPTANAAWLSKDTLAIPLPALAEGGPERLVIYNRAAGTMEAKELPVRDPRDLTALAKGTSILFTALGDDDVRHPFSFDPATRDTARALPWLTQPVTRLSVSEAAGLVAWSTESETELAKIDSGETVRLLPGVTRAVPNDDGRWVILETPGAPISHFNQRSWDEISPQARERELARQEKWLERQPDWVEHETKPPELQLLDLRDDHRYRLTAFFGDEAEWYPAPGHYLAFRLWGIEGKQLNRNIGLTSLAERMRMLGLDQMPLGVEPVDARPSPGEPAPTAPE